MMAIHRKGYLQAWPHARDRVAAMVAPGSGMSIEEVKKVAPIGSPQRVRDVVEQYAAIGVSQMIMMAQGPWKQDIYRRINDEVVAAFA